MYGFSNIFIEIVSTQEYIKILKSVIDKQNKKIEKLSIDLKEQEEEYNKKLESAHKKVNKYRKKYVDLKIDNDETIFDQECEIEALKEGKEMEILKLKGRIFTLETIIEEDVDSGHEVFNEEFMPIEKEWNQVLQQNKTLKENLSIVKGTRDAFKRKYDDLSEDLHVLNKEKDEYKMKYFNLKVEKKKEGKEKEKKEKEIITEEEKNNETNTEEEKNEENPNTPKKLEQSTLTQTPGLMYNGSVITPRNKKKN